MFCFKIFHSGQELHITCNQSIDNIRKIASHNDHVFILTATQQLFFGILNGESPQTQINIELIRSDCIDVACSVDSIYVVDVNFRVQHCPLMAFDFDKRWNEIPIPDYDAIYDGVTSTTCNNIRIVEINCNNDGALFVTENRELYAMGAFDDVCTSDQPIKVMHFINYEILQIEMGSHFAVILTRKRLYPNNHVLDKSISGKKLTKYSINSIDRSFKENLSHSDDLNSLPSIYNEVQSSNLSSNDSINSSIAQSIHDTVEPSIEELVKIGIDKIQTQVWCFGSVNKGQLGTGDHVRRRNCVEVSNLRNQGIIKLSTGYEHTAALTLDGRLYLWGDNSNEQISHWLEKEDSSATKRFSKNEQNILQVQCGQQSTYILTNTLERYELSRNKYFPSIDISIVNHANDVNLDESHQMDHLFLTSKKYIIIGSTFRMLKHEKYLKFEQQFLQDILQQTRPHLETFMSIISRNNILHHIQLYKDFVYQYNCITELTAFNVMTLMNFARHLHDYDSIAFIRYHVEFIHVFRQYTNLYCQINCSEDSTRFSIVPNTDFTSKFSLPIQHIINYIQFINELLNEHSNNETLKSILSHWEQLRIEIDELLESANKTITFWVINKKNIPNRLQTPDRRIILDSKEFPLKLLTSSRFKSNRFILFNDLFCHSTGNSSSFKAFSLKTVWITNVIDKDVSPSSSSSITTASPSSSSTTSTIRRYAYKIQTPEEQYSVSCQTNEAKMIWLESMERQIKETLGKKTTKSNLLNRYTTYTFGEKHRVYPSCRYIGQWNYGKMHGYGCIEYSDNRTYIGQINMNVINGFGRLNLHGISSYDGYFIDGKYDGFGTLKSLHNENYEGYFKNGLKHGFGILNENNRTYIGEFSEGSKNGYGVLDDSDSGEKYMGLFADNVRSGHGFCITVDGKYFEGHFHDNELNGNGVAILTNGYYEGDLTVHGPSGKGSLYLPIEQHQEQNDVSFTLFFPLHPNKKTN